MTTTKTLACLLGISFLATAANASTLRLNFAGGGNVATIYPGETIDVEVWFDISSADTTLAIVQFPMEPIPGDPVLVDDYSVAPGATDVSFGIGSPIGWYTEFSAAYPGAGQALTGVGSHFQGTMTLTSSTLGTHEMVIWHQYVFIADEDGRDFMFHIPYANYSGYVVYGDWGCPGWVTKDWGQERNPLFLNVIPEPGSLSVLALGTFAALRRRR